MSMPSKQFPTLKGMFTASKVSHRRDFLRENKLSLRSLEKETTKKLASKEAPRPKWMPPESTVPPGPSLRRSASHSRIETHTQQQPTSQQSITQRANEKGSISQSRNARRDTTYERHQQHQCTMGRCQSCGTERSFSKSTASDTVMCSRGIQTDDINDEMYLTNALRKCTFSGTHIVNDADARHHLPNHNTHGEAPTKSTSAMQSRYADGDENLSEFNYNGLHEMTKQDGASIAGASRYTIIPMGKHTPSVEEKRELHARSNGGSRKCSPTAVRTQYEDNDIFAGGDSNVATHEREFSPSSVSRQSRYTNKSKNYHTQHAVDDLADKEDRLSRRYDLNLDDEPAALKQSNCHLLQAPYDEDLEPDRMTLHSNASNASTKSKRKEHKLGSRDDLRLPRYLEKEKREKEELKQKDELRDPGCPPGHTLLSEQERLNCLAAAKKRYEALVNELNRLPMTTQTLRVRNRRSEIDKELTIVDDDIRIFSKLKVYIKC